MSPAHRPLRPPTLRTPPHRRPQIIAAPETQPRRQPPRPPASHTRPHHHQWRHGQRPDNRGHGRNDGRARSESPHATSLLPDQILIDKVTPPPQHHARHTKDKRPHRHHVKNDKQKCPPHALILPCLRIRCRRRGRRGGCLFVPGERPKAARLGRGTVRGRETVVDEMTFLCGVSVPPALPPRCQTDFSMPGG